MVKSSPQDQLIQSCNNTSLLDLEYYVDINITISSLRYINLPKFLYVISVLLSKIFSSQVPTVKKNFNFYKT